MGEEEAEMIFVLIWIFFAVVATGLIHSFGSELSSLFFLVNLCMGIGVGIYLAYARIYQYEFRRVYQYLIKYIK
jgi:hypothetical protein